MVGLINADWWNSMRALRKADRAKEKAKAAGNINTQTTQASMENTVSV